MAFERRRGYSVDKQIERAPKLLKFHLKIIFPRFMNAFHFNAAANCFSCIFCPLVRNKETAIHSHWKLSQLICLKTYLPLPNGTFDETLFVDNDDIFVSSFPLVKTLLT